MPRKKTVDASWGTASQLRYLRELARNRDYDEDALQAWARKHWDCSVDDLTQRQASEALDRMRDRIPETCKRGHPLDSANLYMVKGFGWRCRACNAEANRLAGKRRTECRFSATRVKSNQPYVWGPCANGHLPTPDNVVMHGSIKVCRTCLDARKPEGPLGPEPIVTAVEVKRARSWIGVTMEEFARWLGVDPREVWRWERGHGRPSGAAARSIAATAAIAAMGVG
jgi:DNA-binding XRE family transcriptional regulator